ncbi:hypothetical protein C4572_00890 [Candidatus Parcubacteria bacterium]|nr:MAG: hypothetical protein C4572_00890 [Candidatus Parcubacteria bacterium]
MPTFPARYRQRSVAGGQVEDNQLAPPNTAGAGLQIYQTAIYNLPQAPLLPFLFPRNYNPPV